MPLRRAALLLAGIALLLLAGVLAANAGALTTRLAGGLPAPITTLSGGTVIRTANNVKEGDPAPDFQVKLLDGRTTRLADFAGRPLLLNFWASWCLPCKQEMPDLQRAHAAGRIVVLGINATDLDTEDDARRFVSDLGLTFPIALDADGNAQRAYSVRGLPTSVLIAADGRVLAVHVGQMTPEQLDALLAR